MAKRRLREISLTAAFCFLAQFASAGVAGGATFNVNTTSDTVDTTPGDGSCADSTGDCSLRAAFMEANALSGADVVNIPAGTYVLSLPPVDGSDNQAAGGDLDITGALTITGAGAESTIIDGNGAYRVFDTRATVALSGITVTGGFVNGAHGGGIVNSGTLTITDSIITGNSAKQFYSSGGSAAGIYNDGYYKNASLTIINSTVSNNTGIGSVPVGGGIWTRIEGDVTVTLTVINSSITGNSASHGGGIAGSGTIDITNSVIINNTGHQGGGLGIGGTATITGSTISGNYARCQYWNGDGGGIYANSGSVVITNSTISGNGVCYNGEGSGDRAAGIRNNGANITLANSTVSGNYSSFSGSLTGGVLNGGSLTVLNSTITNNSGSSGGIRSIGGTVSLANTIVANQASGPNCSGTITSSGHNLDSDGTCGLVAAGDISVGSANLGPLADNGGLTLTHALQAGSQTINAGDNTVCAGASVKGVDQRGFSRLDGACDIGAFEAMPLHQLALETSGSGSGSVVSDPGKINCPGTCTDQIGENAVVTLTATPDAGSAFGGWSGHCSGTENPLQVTMSADTNCTAAFSIIPRVPEINVTDSLVPTDDLQLPFPDTAVGSSSSVAYVSITNTGDGDLAVSNIQLAGPGAGEFVLDLDPAVNGDGPCGSTAPVIPPGEACSVTIAFGPSSSGAKSATLAITSNDPDEGTANVALSGLGVETNTAPVAVAQLESTAEDTARGIQLSATDAENDPLTYAVVTGPAHGTLSGTAPDLTYTPVTNFNGGDSFSFKANDGSVDSNVATVSITVTPVNDAPQLVPMDDRMVTEGQLLSFTVAATDPDDDAVGLSALVLPEGAEFDQNSGLFVWMPGLDQAGDYLATFRATDTGTPQLSTDWTVAITVTAPSGPVFFDNFADGAAPADWRKVSGAWSASRGVYSTASVTKNNRSTIVPLAPAALPLGAGVVQAKIKLTSSSGRGGPNGQILFAYQDAAHYRYVKVTRSRMQIGQVGIVGNVPGGVKKQKLTSQALNRFALYKVKILRNGWVRVYKGTAKRPVVSYQFLAGGLPSIVKGGVGLAATKARTIFDNVTVWEDSRL